MNEQNNAVVADEDVAWASIETPLDVDELKLFCQDIERLFRINPMLIFKDWQSNEENGYQFSGQNISQEEPFDFDLTLSINAVTDGVQINYQQGIKSSTTFTIEPADAGSQSKSKLTITEDYNGMSEQERKEHLHTVDRSLTVWAKYLQQYFLSWQRWSRFRLWRWYMNRVWQPMKPSGRRITYMLLWITAFEIALIILGVTIYYIEYA
ncbi:hypothetical protein MNBD_GAMMA21-18 [hydrothermal vent metagenome]|uniref:Uncharacterized protein n=1 Tax=hydrothermal vent metagenome TaxID=652676 RepID=A0A3B0ZTB2_9ZZZZ